MRSQMRLSMAAMSSSMITTMFGRVVVATRTGPVGCTRIGRLGSSLKPGGTDSMTAVSSRFQSPA